MQGYSFTSDAAGSLRGRLDRLDGLPIRPASISPLISGRPDRPPAPPPPAELLDPGLALARSSDRAASLWALGSRLPWWEPASGPEADARDRLWRFSVASSLAAARLAGAGGDPDPLAVGRAALLHPLGLWSLAATDPARLAEWLAAEDDADRIRLETLWFGRDAASFGFHLAKRWGAPPELADAALLAAAGQELPAGAAHDPVQLGWVRLGRAWAMSTPWALPGAVPGPPPTDDERRWLVAAVQAHCSGGLTHAEDLPGPESTAREALRLGLRSLQLDREAADLSERARTLVAMGADPEPSQADPPSAPNPVLDAMAEFAAGAAHELNNPLAIIAGRAQLLQARSTDPDQRQALQTIIGQARRAHQILRDLIYIARPPAPRQVPCVPDQVLRGVVDDLKAEAEARRVRLSCQAPEASPTASTDPDALRHMAEALLRNALEATPEGGSVLAASRGDGRTLVWTVRDSGIGLDDERAAHLLDPFYCGRQAGRGLGLGLPRVARFVQSVGGTIAWESAPGGGTTIRVELPLDAGRPESTAPALRDAV